MAYHDGVNPDAPAAAPSRPSRFLAQHVPMAIKMRRLTEWFGGLPATSGHIRSVGRLVLLAALVGTVAGLGAVVFQVLSRCIVYYGLEQVAGYHPSGPAHEGDFLFGPAAATDRDFSPWLLLAVMAGGGLLSGLLVYTLAPEAEGHGTDAAIKAFHRNHGLIRPRVPLVKIVASALTIGSGGSGGREGPIAQIGAGFGSFLAVRLKLSEYERRLLLAAGMGAGVAAIFRAPLAGAIFASEVLYRDEDFESQAIIPSFIACAVAYCIYGLVAIYGFGQPSGFDHIFDIAPHLAFDNPLLLGPLAVLALAMVGAAMIYVRSFYGLAALFKRLGVPRHFKPAVGAVLAGAVAVAACYAAAGLGGNARHDVLNMLSFGYGILQKALSGHLAAYSPMAAVALLLIVGFGKILTTSLTIGSGGSGGVFGPSMVIGGTLGGAVGLLLQMAMPSVATRIDIFVILGMAAFFSAAAKTPISTIIIVSELTGGYELLVPAMWVAALAYLVSGRKHAIYREQVPSRIDSPAHQGEFIRDVLKGMTVRGLLADERQPFTSLRPDATLESIMPLVPTTTQAVFPVTDDDGRLVGLIDFDDVRRFLYRADMGRVIIAEDMMNASVEPLREETDLSAVMGQFASVKYDQLPVVDAGGKVIALIGRQDLVAARERELARLRAPQIT
jgi:CIC family chloride channel protein